MTLHFVFFSLLYLRLYTNRICFSLQVSFKALTSKTGFAVGFSTDDELVRMNSQLASSLNDRDNCIHIRHLEAHATQ